MSALSKPRFPTVALAVGIAASAACNAASAPPGSVIRDSAGVRIVENVGPEWTPETAWRLSQEPVLHIGGMESDPNYELFRVRGAVRLSSGTIIVMNSGTSELRYFNADGSYIRSVGGEGDGPGEFRFLSWARQLAGNSLVAFDARQLRVSYFDENGDFVRSTPVRGGEAPVLQALGMFADGALLVWVPTIPAAPQRTGLRRTAERLFRFATDGSSMDSVGWGAGRESFAYQTGRGFVGSAPHFGRSTQYAAYGRFFYVADNDTYEIKVYSTAGELQSVIRKKHDNLPVTSSDIEVIQKRVAKRLESITSNMAPVFRQMYQEMPFPEAMPAFGRSDSSERTFHVDALGNVWVMEYNRPGDDSKRWTVFDTAGILLGTLRVPDDLVISNIGPDYVLGVRLDDLDVEHVMMYGLVKPVM